MRDVVETQNSEPGELVIERVALSALTLDPANAREHDERNIAAIAASYRRFGQQKPIVVDAAGKVIAGNGQLEAAHLLGLPTMLVVRTKLTGAEAVAFALADNRTAELARWHKEHLAQLLGTLDADLVSDIGWDAKDLAAVMGARDLPEDEPAPPPEKPVTRKGELIELGEHRLYCGNCVDGNSFSILLQGAAIDCTVTDPPYNVAYEGKTSDRLTIENDSMPEAEFVNFLRGSMHWMCHHSKPGAACYVFHADSRGEAFRVAFRESGFMLKQCLVWVKDAFVMGRQDYHWQHEPILYGWKPGAAHSWYGARNKGTVIDDDAKQQALPEGGLEHALRELRECTTVLREPRPRANADHPTMKPVRLVGRLLQNSTKPGDVVLDPFAGSGSTLIACEHLRRRCMAIELDPRYCDVIVERWQQVTGKPWGEEDAHRVNPSALTPEELARMLALATRREITVQHILSDIGNGAPVNQDGTVNLIHYAAWLISKK